MKRAHQGNDEPAQPPESGDQQLQMVAVNDNGMMLLSWFRSLPGHEKARIMRAVGVAEKLRH